jgi:hypothetical protein
MDNMKPLIRKIRNALSPPPSPHNYVWHEREDKFTGKVFCIGAGKTGTTSLEKAIVLLGYDLAPQARAEMLVEDCYRGDFRRLIRFCDLHQAFQDAPFCFADYYKALDRAFPQSKFILTQRSSPEEWFHSLCEWQKKGMQTAKAPTEKDLDNSPYAYRGYALDNMKRFFDYPSTPLYNKDAYVKMHEKRNKEIIDYFKGRPNQLLILNVAEPAAFAKLGDFLGFDVPSGEQFPWENKT